MMPPPTRFPTSYADERRLQRAAEESFTPLTPASYPPPTYTRTLAAAGALGQDVTLPRTRLFPFVISAGASARSSLSMGPLHGIAVMIAFEYDTLTGSDPYTQTMELGTAPIQVTEKNVGLAIARPFNVLTELVDLTGYGNAGAGRGFPLDTVPNAHSPYEYRPKLIVQDQQFYFVVSVTCASIQTFLAFGHVSIVENLSSEQVLALLG